MPTVCLLGASGYTGRLVARELQARKLPIIACGRDLERVRAAVAGIGDAVVGVRRIDAREPDSLRAAFADAAVAITTIGPYTRLGKPVVDAALAAGCHLVDVSGEQDYVRWVHDERADAARDAGVTLVPGGGMTGAIGTLLAALAVGAAGPGATVHVAYTTASDGIRAGWSAGTRRSLAAMLGRTGWAYEDGRLVDEPLGEARRLAWFPRPVGPMHAAVVPGIEALVLPRHLADVRAVHTYLAMSTWKAELLQAVASAARRESLRRRLVAWLERDLDDPSEERRARTRWACVAEAEGEFGLARAWAYGRDVYATAASMAVELASAAAQARRGVLAASAVADPAVLLDRLSVHTGLRWSVVRPEA